MITNVLTHTHHTSHSCVHIIRIKCIFYVDCLSCIVFQRNFANSIAATYAWLEFCAHFSIEIPYLFDVLPCSNFMISWCKRNRRISWWVFPFFLRTTDYIIFHIIFRSITFTYRSFSNSMFWHSKLKYGFSFQSKKNPHYSLIEIILPLFFRFPISDTI